MAIDDNFLTLVGKEEYGDIKDILTREVEQKMKTQLTGFTNYIEKNAFVSEPVSEQD